MKAGPFPTDRRFIGRGRIVAMELWDTDFIGGALIASALDHRRLR
jgi:hypothetical protein